MMPPDALRPRHRLYLQVERFMTARQKPVKVLYLAFWYANGLSAKRFKLQDFIMRHAVDLVLINETYPVEEGAPLTT